jgi:dTDP-4-dehydrorhamnose 3,5-epimerase
MGEPIKIKVNPRISTKNSKGLENGFLVPIINVLENFLDDERWPKQVYLTVVKAGEVKGPHLHKKRWGLFTCIKGNVKIVVRTNLGYGEYCSGENHGFATVQIPAGIPAALVNIGKEDAYILNMPSPSWKADDPDEWEVAFADYDFSTQVCKEGQE